MDDAVGSCAMSEAGVIDFASGFDYAGKGCFIGWWVIQREATRRRLAVADVEAAVVSQTGEASRRRSDAVQKRAA